MDKSKLTLLTLSRQLTKLPRQILQMELLRQIQLNKTELNSKTKQTAVS